MGISETLPLVSMGASVPKRFLVKISISRVLTMLPTTAPRSPTRTAEPRGTAAVELLYMAVQTMRPIPKAVPRLVSAGNWYFLK